MHRVNVRTFKPVNKSQLSEYDRLEYKTNFFNLNENENEKWNGYYVEVEDLKEVLEIVNEPVKFQPSSFIEADFTATVTR